MKWFSVALMIGDGVGSVLGAMILGMFLLWWLVGLFHRRPARGDGKIACVTGAASGVGRATAVRLAELGWTVLACDVDKKRLKDLESTPHIKTHVVDLADHKSCSDLVAAVHALCTCSCNGLDALVNVAGVLLGKPLLECTDEEVRLQTEVNALGPMRLMRDLSDLLITGAGGSVVNVTSIGGRDAWPWTGAYSASKYALEGATDGARREARANGLPLRFVILEPGPVDTPMAEAQLYTSHEWVTGHQSSPWQPGMKSQTDFRNDLNKRIGYKRLMSWAGLQPEQVAEEIARVASDVNPPARILCCKLAFKAFFYSVLLAPPRIGDALMRLL